MARVHLLAGCVVLGIGGGAWAQGATQNLSITANVSSTCRLGGTATPAAINATIPITPSGGVVTTPQDFNVANVFCTLPASVLATSMNGGLKVAQPAGGGFTNIINYTATARYGFATSTINTATVPTANSPESGNPALTFLPWFGRLRIRITPAASALPLVGGTYQDVLRVTLTPQF